MFVSLTYIEQVCKSLRKLTNICHNEEMPKGTNTPVGPLSVAIAELLHAQMAHLRSNKTKLAEAAGIARTTLGPIIDGQKTFDVEVLDRICMALGLDVVDVLKEADLATQGRVIASGIRPIRRPA